MELQIEDTVLKIREETGAADEDIWLIFDFVGTRDQAFAGRSGKGLAHKYADRLFTYVAEHFPDLGGVVVGITDDEDRRPMRDTLLTNRMSLDEIDNKHKHVLWNDQSEERFYALR